MTTETDGIPAERGNVLALVRPKSESRLPSSARDAATEKRWADGFFEIEAEICDLARAADLALFVYQHEAIGCTKISESGATASLVLEMLVEKAQGLKTVYYAHHCGAEVDDDADDDDLEA